MRVADGVTESATRNLHSATSERLPDPELRPRPADRVLEVEAAGEVPVELEAEEVEGEAPADGAGAIDEAVVLDERVRLSLQLRAADIEEDVAAHLLQDYDRRGQDVDQREAELEVGESGGVADDGTEVVAAHGIQAAEVVEVRRVAAGVGEEEARGDQ